MGTKKTPLRHALLLCFLLCLVVVHLTDGKRDNNNNKAARAKPARQKARGNRCKNKTTFTLNTSALRKGKVFKCAKGPVVAMEMTAIKAKCRGTTGFTRWNAGRCMWNKTCEVTFNQQGIDSLEPKVKDKSCLGQIPSKLEISYTCLKKKVTVTDILGQFNRTKKRAGVIRSHKLFPWSYRNGQSLGNITFVRPRKPAGLANLWISVHYYSLLSSDIIFLSWEGKPPPEERDPKDPHPPARQRIQAMRQLLPNDTLVAVSDVSKVTLTFYADYRSQNEGDQSGEEEESKGFLLCYQWLKAKGKPKKESACSKVMMPAKCKNKKKKGSGKKRGKGAKGGNSKDGGPSNNNNNNQNAPAPSNNKARRPRGKQSRRSRPGRISQN